MTEQDPIATIVQMLADIAVIGVVARVIVGAVGAGLRRKAATTTPADAARGSGATTRPG